MPITYSATARALAPVAGTTAMRARAGGQVDIVQAHAQPAHRPQPGRAGEQGGVHLAAVAHDERVRFRHGLQQPVAAVHQLRLVAHVEARAQRTAGASMNSDMTMRMAVLRRDQAIWMLASRMMRAQRSTSAFR